MMTRVVFVGGGVVGLCGALLLARDGHEVTVLERDPTKPPSPEAAWNDWERRGVNQFRMLHYFMPRFRELAEANLPDVARDLGAAGAATINLFRSAPADVTGGFRADDTRYDALTARRPVAEAVVAQLADRCDGIDVRRGVVVQGLLTDDSSRNGVPHVIGVRTNDGTDLGADVVIDAAGRRSMLPRWLADVGAQPPIEELDDCGFIYYGRHFRSTDGSLPPMFGPLLIGYETVSILTLPADNGTWGVGVITSAKDPALRRLKDVDVWSRVVAGYPLQAHWLEGEPIDDTISVMAKIEDRHRTFVVDNAPLATGVLPLADAWACTNPSVGRGISMGMIHAVALRDLFHEAPDDPDALARAWHESTLATVEPWYRSTLAFDRGRLEQIHAELDGRTYEPDPGYELTMALMNAAGKDPECLRALLAIISVLDLPETALGDEALLERVIALGAGWRDEPPPGLTRAELLTTVAA